MPVILGICLKPSLVYLKNSVSLTLLIGETLFSGFVCVRGFDQKTRAPRPLKARLHFPASRLVKTKNEKKWQAGEQDAKFNSNSSDHQVIASLVMKKDHWLTFCCRFKCSSSNMRCITRSKLGTNIKWSSTTASLMGLSWCYPNYRIQAQLKEFSMWNCSIAWLVEFSWFLSFYDAFF